MHPPSDAQPSGDAELAALLAAVAAPPTLPKGIGQQLAWPEALQGEALDERVAPQLGAARYPGSVLDGRFRLERPLGRGGMGVVWAAENIRTGARVALKWVAPERGLSTPRVRAALERLRREARAAARVQHPHVVTLYDVAGSDDAPYLVMELCQGESLRERLARGKLGWDDALAILLPVLAGVTAVHAAGVIHRDLKPDNLFLSRGADGAYVPKVLDFGVAAVRDVTPEGEGALTRTGAVLGTPAYMSLEQLTARPVDVRTDVYALGVVLYEMLTGALPYDAGNASELAVLLATASPTPPSRHVPALRGPREAALLRALARAPGERFASVEAFAAALKRAGPRRLTGLRTAAATLVAGTVIASVWALSAHAPQPSALPVQGGSAAPGGPVPAPAARSSAPAAMLAQRTAEDVDQAAQPDAAVPSAADAGRALPPPPVRAADKPRGRTARSNPPAVMASPPAAPAPSERAPVDPTVLRVDQF